MADEPVNLRTRNAVKSKSGEGKSIASPLTFAIVVGEASGDNLGANLIRSLKNRYPGARFEGVGGPLMIQEGFESIFPMERLAVMGIVEPLKRLPELLHIRQTLTLRYLKGGCDCFIGIDAPDFNLELERRLKTKGLPVVHYVSPSVWAWRQKRVYKIAKACDLLLSLFPFEAKYYADTDLDVVCVGHTLADQRPLVPDQSEALDKLARLNSAIEAKPEAAKRMLALLPGSRVSEIEKIGSTFIRAAILLIEQYPDFIVAIPAANEKLQAMLNEHIAETVDASFQGRFIVVLGNAQSVLEASDLVLISSGTATLEALIAKKPMVIGYRVAFATYHIVRRLLSLKNIGLPNLLAGSEVVPEFVQDALQPEAVFAALADWIEHPEKVDELVQIFNEIHKSLRLNAGDTACQAIEALLASKI